MSEIIGAAVAAVEYFGGFPVLKKNKIEKEVSGNLNVSSQTLGQFAGGGEGFSPNLNLMIGEPQIQGQGTITGTNPKTFQQFQNTISALNSVTGVENLNLSKPDLSSVMKQQELIIKRNEPIGQGLPATYVGPTISPITAVATSIPVLSPSSKKIGRLI